jgi:electron transport complex protein RnfG
VADDMKKSLHLKPTIVLVSVVAAVTLALALVNMITNPVIEERLKKAADETRFAVFSEAGSFSSIPVERAFDPDGNILDVFVADNGKGVVITSQSSGFGGKVTVMTGIRRDGEITGVSVLDHRETPGIGDKPMEEDYLKIYIGASEIVLRNSASDGGGIKIDTITGATITSVAIFNAVETALAYFANTGGL